MDNKLSPKAVQKVLLKKVNSINNYHFTIHLSEEPYPAYVIPS